MQIIPLRLKLEFKKRLLILIYSGKLIVKLIAIDQITKWWFISYLKQKPNMSLKISSFLDVVYTWNHGISFGMFKNFYQYSNATFIGLNSIITIYLWSQIFKFKSAISFVGYSLIVGGAIGNIIDRLFRGAVFDFIYFHYKDFNFPIFNLADAFISVGAAILIYDYYKAKKSTENDEEINKAKKLIEQNDKTNYDALEDAAEKIRNLSDQNLSDQNSEEK